MYNYTWKCERAVEIPIIWKMVENSQNKRILEVGNVLSHYFHVHHDIVDKYEVSEGIINEDVVDYKPFHKYDLIISISTLEHVGYDEAPQKSQKILHAISNLQSLLMKDGKFVITIPLGYNHYLDKILKGNEIQFSERYYLQRISKDSWVEVDGRNVANARYNSPFPAANALLVGIL
jgi:hypothetical protein